MKEFWFGGGIAVLIAAALYIWKSNNKPAKAVRSIFVRGSNESGEIRREEP